MPRALRTNGLWPMTGPLNVAGQQISNVGPMSQAVKQIIEAAQVTGQRGFRLPLGVLVRAGSDDISLVELSTDGGVTWAPLTPVVDWAYMSRRAGWPHASTADASCGVFLTSGVANSGDLVRLTYVTRSLALRPPEPCVVRATGGVVDLTQQRWRYNSPTPTNAVLLPNVQGLQIEVWTWGRNSGQAREAWNLPGFFLRIPGRRWRPMMRLALATESGEVIFEPSTNLVTSGPRVQSFRFCYYDPASGARSELSAAQVRWQKSRDEKINGNIVHGAGSVWMTRM